MNKMTHIEIWRVVAAELGIHADGPVQIRLKSGITVDADVLIRNFGDIKGTIVVSDSNKLIGLHDALAQEGYAYSVMDPPRIGEEYIASEYIDVLVDWGWTGPIDGKPAWCRKD